MAGRRRHGAARALAALSPQAAAVPQPPHPLAVRLREADESALAELIREQWVRLQQRLRRKFKRLRDWRDREEVVSTSLCRLWMARSRLDVTRSPLGYLWRIVQNVARDLLKSRAHRQWLAEKCVDPAKLAAVRDRRPASLLDEPDAAATPRPELQASPEIIARLPEKQRRIMEADAGAADGVANTRELARELNIAEATVRRYRSIARATIRRSGPPPDPATEGTGDH